ncbi:MAG: radical SAM protein [Dehalococcoidia bacterium]|nr:radical SAM protein [Dehalococcoidia bacterium]
MWEQTAFNRRRISKEQGAIIKDWGGRFPIALAYPNAYYLGMSSLGFQTIYGLLNSFPEVVCERLFLDGVPNTSRGERTGGGRRSPGGIVASASEFRTLSLESGREAREFAVVGFSISFEIDYFNIVEMIRRSGIPLFARDRDEGDPLVMAGGPCVFANPAPIVPFFDFLVIGEGEPAMPVLIETLLATQQENRKVVLAELSKIPGIYVPGVSPEPVKRIWAKDLDSFATTSVVYSDETELGDMHLVEIARGCGRACRFCLAGYAFRPVRYRSVKSILEAAQAGLRFRKRVGLVSAATSDHPEIDELATRLREMGALVAVSSLRLNPLSESLLKALIDSGTRTITFAPEAGSERLRSVINKQVAVEDVFRGVEMAARLGARQLKLYFMAGLPSETDGDVKEIIDLSLECKERFAKIKRGGRLTVSVTPFVPKAGTPFQWEAMADPATLKRRLAIIKSGLKRDSIDVRAESVDWSVVQAVLSRGDQRLSMVLANMQDNSLAAWNEAMAGAGLSASDMTGPRDNDEVLPWSVIDLGGSTEAIRRQRDSALRRG